MKLSPLQLLEFAMPWMGLITVVSAIVLEAGRHGSAADCCSIVQQRPRQSPRWCRSVAAREDVTGVLTYQPNSVRSLAILLSSVCGMLANVSSTWAPWNHNV